MGHLTVIRLLCERLASTRGACDRTADSSATLKCRETKSPPWGRCWDEGGCEYIKGLDILLSQDSTYFLILHLSYLSYSFIPSYHSYLHTIHIWLPVLTGNHGQ